MVIRVFGLTSFQGLGHPSAMAVFSTPELNMFKRIESTNDLKLVVSLEVALSMIVSAATLILARSQTEAPRSHLLAKALAPTGSREMEGTLAEEIDSGRLTKAQIFDENHVRVPDTDPPKLHTAYDAFPENRNIPKFSRKL